MRIAVIKNNIVEDIVDTEDMSLVQLIARTAFIIEIGNLDHSPKKGWVLQGNKLVPPPNYNADQVIQETILEPAIEFLTSLMKRFASENVRMGITQAGKTGLIGNALKDVAFWIPSGSAYEFEKAIGDVEITEEMAPFLTEARVTALRNEVRRYLGMPQL